MSKRTCTIDGCETPIHAQGYCASHYMKVWRYGDPTVDRRRPVSFCSISGCDSPVKGKGWCRKHYLRWYKHGDPEYAYVRPLREPKPCAVDDCVREAQYRGWCEMHYDRWKNHGSTDDPRLTVEERFWSYVDKDGPIPAHRPELGQCWLWQTPGPNGYGMLHIEGKYVGAHRFSFELAYGDLPPEVDHQCHNRACVNPSHLRRADRKRNIENFTKLSSRNTTGFRGVYKQGNRYVARVGHNGRTHNAGSYGTAHEAGEAARQLRLKLHTHNDLDRIA